MHALLKASRKQQLGKTRATSAMSFIDQLDTQPMEEPWHEDGARELVCNFSEGVLFFF